MKRADELYKAVLCLQNLEEAQRFFRDLLTESEIVEFSNRWQVARMLSEGVSYAKIEQETGMSSTTIARINKWLQNGKNGYKLALDRLHHHQPYPAGERTDEVSS